MRSRTRYFWTLLGILIALSFAMPATARPVIKHEPDPADEAPDGASNETVGDTAAEPPRRVGDGSKPRPVVRRNTLFIRLMLAPSFSRMQRTATLGYSGTLSTVQEAISVSGLLSVGARVAGGFVLHADLAVNTGFSPSRSQTFNSDPIVYEIHGDTTHTTLGPSLGATYLTRKGVWVGTGVGLAIVMTAPPFEPESSSSGAVPWWTPSETGYGLLWTVHAGKEWRVGPHWSVGLGALFVLGYTEYGNDGDAQPERIFPDPQVLDGWNQGEVVETGWVFAPGLGVEVTFN